MTGMRLFHVFSPGLGEKIVILTYLFCKTCDNWPRRVLLLPGELREFYPLGAAGSRGRLTGKPLYFQENLHESHGRCGTKTISGAFPLITNGSVPILL
jgi:hypothetical protein